MQSAELPAVPLKLMKVFSCELSLTAETALELSTLQAPGSGMS